MTKHNEPKEPSAKTVWRDLWALGKKYSLHARFSLTLLTFVPRPACNFMPELDLGADFVPKSKTKTANVAIAREVSVEEPENLQVRCELTTSSGRYVKMKKFAYTSVAALMLSTSGAYACGQVSVGAMGWASGEALAALTGFVLEQGYGCEVTIVPTDTVPAVTSLAENGQPDIVPEVWVNSATVYAGLEAEGKVITASNTFSNGGEEGWWISTAAVEANPELATIEGVLANAELVGGRFNNCPVGWGCRIVNDALKVVFDLEGNGIEVFDHGSGANLAASIAAADEAGEPWFGYYWGPTAILGKYDLTKVDLGPIDGPQHAINQNADADPATWGPSDFPAATVVNAVTADLAEREPDVADFMRNMEMPNNIVSSMLAWAEENGASADEAAAWVLTNHSDMILGWMSEDAATRVSALLQ